VPVDFVATHEYPTDPGVVGGNMMPVFQRTLSQVRAVSPTLPLFYSEFNDGLFSNPSWHDWPYASSYLVKMMASMGETFHGQIPLLSYWTFTDVFEEGGMPAQEFDKPTGTGWGLLSTSGIPKPSYRAFQLLHGSGDCTVPVSVAGGDPSIGAMAVVDCKGRRQNSTRLFVWSNVWPTQSRSAASVFNFTITLPSAQSPVTMTRIDDSHANAPQLWRDDGRPLYLKPADIKRYLAASELGWVAVSKPCVSSCTLGPFELPQNGLAVFAF
jgi:xylan 1,4-beta-xylosidase